MDYNLTRRITIKMKLHFSALKCLYIAFLVTSVVNCCPHAPMHLPHGRRTRGDNGYKLILADGSNGYEPGRSYNLVLLGSRTHSKIQHFTHFTIAAEAVSGLVRQPASPKRVGRFQLFGDALTTFNEHCVNTVSEANDLLKTEIQVMWVAPESRSGCVSLSAMVYENSRSWFSDDGHLTYVICEKQPNIESIRKDCCACSEANYNFIFEGIWSNETHPKDYPFAIWLTHFSDIIGASHEPGFSFWGENHIATDGFRSLAEWGSPSALEAELRTNGPRLRTLIKAPGLWYPNVNANVSSKFRVDRRHPKVSIVSMFGPSPDWIVGVNGINLCTEDCTWKESVEIDLYPWDAGTDSGISYMSPNSETQPRERMYRITTMYPEDPRSPFYNPNASEVIPLAKLYIRREKIVSKNCDEEFLQTLQVEEELEEQEIRGECRVGEYSEWSPCSTTCGKGIKMRTRQYLDPKRAEMANCGRQLVSKEMCVAEIPECRTQKDDLDDHDIENFDQMQSGVNKDGEGVGICKTTPWTVWSTCSASCGIGIIMRTRTFHNHLGRKRCPHITIVEKEKCMQPECTYEEIDLPDPLCPTTQWSEWSPCTATCGHGVTIRTRLLLLEDEVTKEDCKRQLQLHQQKECTFSHECTLNLEISRDICSNNPDIGPCRGTYIRYAYNKVTGVCESFTYGGCRGNRNNFLTESDCYRTCNTTGSSVSTSLKPDTSVKRGESHGNPKSTDSTTEGCVMSEWSNWSECSVTCGLGYSERYRHIIAEPKNGGQSCPKRMIKHRRCKVMDC